MALDPRKRQRKLQKRKAKQKVKRLAVARRQARGFAGELQDASVAPILHCCASTDVWDQGIGNVLISRQLRDGRVAFVVFLVDVYCLGVKDAIMNVAPRSVYEDKLYGELDEQFTLIALKPECVRKLVEGAVEYALGFGLPPHPDYTTARLIFGDISAEVCSERYVYGKDGKPFFVAGPYDDSAKREHILRSLENHAGPDGYHFMMPMDEAMLDDLEVLDEDEPDDPLLEDLASCDDDFSRNDRRTM